MLSQAHRGIKEKENSIQAILFLYLPSELFRDDSNSLDKCSAEWVNIDKPLSQIESDKDVVRD